MNRMDRFIQSDPEDVAVTEHDDDPFNETREAEHKSYPRVRHNPVSTVKMSESQQMSDNVDNPRVVKVETVASTKWLALQEITYNDEEGNERLWNAASRTTKKSSNKADAVVIVPILKHYNKPDVVDTLIVEQFRPPVRRKTVEFPAGLIDESETPEQAALRELLEETGYVGEKCKTLPKVSRAVCMSPGVTDESVHIVVVMVDLDNPYNKNPKAEPDDGEYIQVRRVSLKSGLQKVLDNNTNMAIEGLYLFSLGLEIGRAIESKSDKLF